MLVRNKILGAMAALVAVFALVMGFAVSATAAVPGEAVPANIVGVPLTRVVNTNSTVNTLANNQTRTVPVAGVAGIPSNATYVEGILTVYLASGNTALVAWGSNSGAPGTPTVTSGATTASKPSGNSAAFGAQLISGAIKVHNTGATTRFLLSITAYGIPVSAPAADTFGYAQFQVDGTTWANFETVENNSTVGDNATGFVRFSCKNATDGCDVSLKSWSTASGWTVYPRILLTKEDNTTGGKFTCEYADGADNSGASQALTSSAATVNLGIGSTADCGGNQTGAQPASVDHINVPGLAGQGVHYDVDLTLIFAHTS